MTDSKTSEYRQHAHRCLELAGSLPWGQHRAFLLETARNWHRLAQEQEDAAQPNTAGTDG
jgi:hypothetical protein